jgi:hypothetical protein
MPQFCSRHIKHFCSKQNIRFFITMIATPIASTSDKLCTVKKACHAYPSKLPSPTDSFTSCGDKLLQSTKRRRYMRRGSRCPSMLTFSLPLLLALDKQEPIKIQDKCSAVSLLAEALNLSAGLEDCDLGSS